MDGRKIFGKIERIRKALAEVELEMIDEMNNGRLYEVLEKTDDKIIVSKNLPENIVSYKELMEDYELSTELTDRSIFIRKRK